MKEKIKCKKCQLLIDSELDSCPYCGYENNHEEESKNDALKEEIKIEEKAPRKELFPSKVLILNKSKEWIVFIMGYLLLQVISIILSTIALSLNFYFANSLVGSAILNFSTYFILFGVLLCYLGFDVLLVLKPFKKLDTYLRGIGYGIILIIATVITSLIMKAIYDPGSSNQNEQSINLITIEFPFLSLIIFGFIGPIVEELAYRLGLFGFFKKINRPAAYILTALVFGLIHFNFATSDFLLELVNLPPYIVAGLVLCFIYDKEGIGTSIMAHVVNNVYSVLMTIIAINLL